MNHCYRIIWNRSRSMFMVVAENVRSYSRAHGGKIGTIDINPTPVIDLRRNLLARAISIIVAGAGSIAPLCVYGQQPALPMGGDIVAGAGEITQSDNALNVRQDTNKMIANWQSFNIAKGHEVNFHQPSVSSVALNRVLGSDASDIYGSLNANGQVFLVNPNGVFFSQSSSVDVGGLVASTLDITNENFLQGNYVFEGKGNNGSVINHGSIRAADGGAIALLGGQVSNEGLIAARLGAVAMAAGDKVTLDFAGDGLLSVSVDRAAYDALVSNHQLIEADGGSVLMTAKASDALLQTVVNNTGVIQAQTVEKRKGKIVLLGGFNGGTVEVAGKLDASAPNGGDGGFIETSGAYVEFENASITAKSIDGDSGEWLIDPADLVIDEGKADVISDTLNQDTDVSFVTGVAPEGEVDPEPAGRGNIYVEAEIIKTAAPRQTIGNVERTLTARGDVLPGIETEDLAEGVQVIYLDRYEINDVNDENFVSRTLMEVNEANELLANGDPSSDLFSKYEITAVPDDIDVVNVVKRTVENVPTLSFESGWGNIEINAPIRSVNGALNVVLRAGSLPDAGSRTEQIDFNADIITNGGDLAAQANAKINVADGVTLSTRDLFGLDTSAQRIIGTGPEQINSELFSQASQLEAYTTGESGNIVLMVDKFANGFSNFLFFYRSDLSEINIGKNAALLAESNEARDGSIRVLSVSNIGDLFEALNWLGVRNFTSSKIDIGEGATIKGGAIDIIADASSSANVGDLINNFVITAVEDGMEGVSPTVTINEDDTFNSATEAYQVFTDLEEDPFTVNDVATKAIAEEAIAEDLPGYQGGLEAIPQLSKLTGKKLGSGLSSLLSKVPIADILTVSPIAIAIAESDSTVTVRSNALISGTDVVTVRANSSATANADAEFPGLAFSLAMNNSNATMNVESGANIISYAQDRQETTPQLLNDQPLLRFDTSKVESFGVARDYLSPANRGSLAAVDVAAVSNTTSTIKVAAATLDLASQQELADSAAKERAKKDGTTSVPAPEDRRASDSPVDVALGIAIGDNRSTLNISEGAVLESNLGTVSTRAEAHVLKSNNQVTGGKLQTPEIQCTQPIANSCHTTSEYDASDIVNVAVSISSVTNMAEANINGVLKGKSVSVSSLAETEKMSNGAVSEQGYDNDYDQNEAASKMRTKLASVNDRNEMQQFAAKVSGTLSDLVKDKSNANGNTKITLVESGPESQAFGLAGGVAVNVINQGAKTNIGSTSVMESNGGRLDVSTISHSGIVNNYAKTGVQNGRTNAVAASVAVGIYSYNADTMVNDGATFRAINPIVSDVDLENGLNTAITVSSQSYIDSPFLLTKYQKNTYETDAKAADLASRNGLKSLKGFATGAEKNDIVDYARSRVNDLLENGELLTTNWASSYYINGGSPAYKGTGTNLGTEDENPTTEALNDKTDYSSDVSVAGSFGVLTTDNNASTVIGKATFEVMNGDPSNANDINIVAETWSHTIMAAGNVAPPDENTDNPLETFAPGDRAGNGMGGSLNVQEGSSTVNVDIKDGASFLTAHGTMSAWANNHRETQLVQVSGGLAKDVGVNGAFGINVFDDQVSSHVADGAFINAKGLAVSSIISQPGILNLSGGFAFGGAVGIGVGIGINIVNREAEAILGFKGEGDQSEGGGKVNVKGLNVKAAQLGFITNIDVAGGLQVPEDDQPPVQGGAGTTAVSQADPEDASKEMAGGVGISGSVAVNISNAKTKAHASLDDGSTIDNSINVSADDGVDITGLSGGAGLTINGGVAVAGAASINTVVSDTDAILEAKQSEDDYNKNGAAYTPYDATIQSSNTGRIQAVAVGVAVVAGVSDPDKNSDGPSVAAAGSFSYNSVRNDVFSDIQNSRIELGSIPDGVSVDDGDEDQKATLKVLSADAAQITSIAGAVAVSAGKENNMAAVGASAAINTIQNRTEALIENTTISDSDDTDNSNVIVGASHMAPITSISVAGGAGQSKAAIAGSVVINTINTEDNMGTLAGIKNSNVAADGELSVYAGDEAQIVSLAGAIAATTGSVGVGGAFVWNEISGDIATTIEDSTIIADKGINVRSETLSPDASPDAPLPSLDELKESAKNAGRDVATIVGRGALGAISLRDEEIPPAITPVDTNDLIDGSNGIYSAAVAGGSAGDAAVFGSFAVNSLHKAVAASVRNSDMRTGGNILVTTDAQSIIRSLAGSVAVSMGTAGVGGAGTYNTIRDTSLVTFENSDVSGENISLNAMRSGEVSTLGAAAAVASSVGVQGSTAITTLAGETGTVIEGGSITANQRTSLDASSSVDTETSAGGVAGGGTAAVGASLALTIDEDSTYVELGTTDATSVNGGSAVDIAAESFAKHYTTVMTGALGVGAAGVAGSVGIKVVNTDTSATLGGLTKINDENGYSGTVTISSDASLALAGAAGAVGGSGGAGVGAGLDLSVVNSTSRTMIADGAFLKGLNVYVRAENERDISSMTVAGGGGLAGVAGAVSIVHVGGGDMNAESSQALGLSSYKDSEGNTQQEDNVLAYAQGKVDSKYSAGTISTLSDAPIEGDTLAVIGAATVDAVKDVEVSATARHDVDVISGAVAGGAVGVGAGVASVTYNSATRALTQNATITTGADVTVNAQDEDKNTHTAWWQPEYIEGGQRDLTMDLKDGNDFGIQTFAGSAGIAALGAAVAMLNRDNDTSAEIRGGTTMASGKVDILANRDRYNRLFSLGAQVGAAAVGASIADVTNNGQVLASAGGLIGSDDQRASSVVVKATGDNKNDVMAAAAAMGVVSATGTVAAIRGESLNLDAEIVDGTQLYLQTHLLPGESLVDSNTGRLDMEASGSNADRALADGTSAGAGVGVGAVESRFLYYSKSQKPVCEKSQK